MYSCGTKFLFIWLMFGTLGPWAMKLLFGFCLALVRPPGPLLVCTAGDELRILGFFAFCWEILPVPGEAGRIPPELAGRSCYCRLLIFKLLLLLFDARGFELLGLCFCTEPPEIRLIAFLPLADEAAVLRLPPERFCYWASMFCLRVLRPLAYD